MTHSDDKGLIIPPKVATYKVVIIPIYYKEDDKKKVLKKVKEIIEQLEKEGIAAIADYREAYTPGYKYNEWEMKGVPLRIEIGPKDLQKKQVVIVRRDDGKKSAVSEKGLAKKVNKELDDIQQNLWKKAKKFLDENIREVKDYTEFKKILEEKGGFVKTGWCGMDHCEEQVKIETSATIRLVPEKEKAKGKCIYCGMNAKYVVYFAKSY
jgi:prolyl-tRNA synthetase